MELRWTRSIEYVQQKAVEIGAPVQQIASMEATAEVIRALPKRIRQTLFHGGRQYTSDVGHVTADHTGRVLPYAVEKSFYHGRADILGDYEPEDMTLELWTRLWDAACRRATAKAAKRFNKERPKTLAQLEAMRAGECPYEIAQRGIHFRNGSHIARFVLTDAEWADAEQLARKMMKDAARENEEREAREERERQARLKQESKEQRAWIRAHGSERLLICMEEGIECDAIYRDERLHWEAPDWVWDRWDYDAAGWVWDKQGSDKVGYSEPRNPPLSALKMLRKARRLYENAELLYAICTKVPEEDDCYATEEDVWYGHVCAAKPRWARNRTALLLPADCPLAQEGE